MVQLVSQQDYIPQDGELIPPPAEILNAPDGDRTLSISKFENLYVP